MTQGKTATFERKGPAPLLKKSFQGKTEGRKGTNQGFRMKKFYKKLRGKESALENIENKEGTKHRENCGKSDRRGGFEQKVCYRPLGPDS